MQNTGVKLPGKKIVYEERVLKKIIGQAADSVPGVLGPGGGGLLSSFQEATETLADMDVTRGVTVQAHGGHLRAQVLITTEEDADMPRVMAQVKERVTAALLLYTDLILDDIHVEIVDTEQRAEFAERFRQG